MLRYYSVATVIDRAGKELGLWTATLADPFASADPNVVQMLALLTTLGQELVDSFNWPQLVLTGTVTGDGSTTLFDLPADYVEMVPQSMWNRTTRLPVLGPVSPQEWEARKVFVATATLYNICRIVHKSSATVADQFEFIAAPANGADIRYEYRSRAWVQTAAAASPGLDAPTAATDRILFDPLLSIRGVKLFWRREKGFDTAQAQADFDKQLAHAKSDLSPAPNVNLARSQFVVRPIDTRNIPDTGYGS